MRILPISLAVMLAASMIGCTLYPTKNPPTLASTTSAEQHERILWQMAQKQQWDKIAPLLSTTLVWSVDGRRLASDQVLAYLQSLHVKDVQVRDASVQPNGADMTVSYTLQLSGANGALQEFSVFSVWQQLKNGGYVLIAHSQQAQPGSSAAAAATR